MKSGEICRRRTYQEAVAITEVFEDAMSGFNNGQAIDRRRTHQEAEAITEGFKDALSGFNNGQSIYRISNRCTKYQLSGRKGGNYPYAVRLCLDFFRNITRLQFKCST